jgi:predicted transcriptional regulator
MIENAADTEDKQAKVKGRPKIEIDVEILRNLCEIQCTVKEIAYVLGVSVDTLNRNYSEAIQAGKSQGKIALRRAQWRNALEKNNVTMQIWLGKNVLNQTDAPLDEEAGQILPWTD